MNTTANDNLNIRQSLNNDNDEPSAKLELFAEELPAQSDLLRISTTGTGSTVGTLGGSTISSASTISTVGS